MINNKEKEPIPVIDIFAGPGGLGEGFSSLPDEDGNKAFRIALSIEKDEFAHQTLELRSFFRQFARKNVPEEYYEHLRGETSRKKLFEQFPSQSKKASREAWKAELGLSPQDEIDTRIEEALDNAKHWILIGGPPCQAYSVMGRVRQQWKNGLDEADPRVYLYREYYRILADHNPPVFIMENVKGLLSSKVSDKFIIEEILNDLRNPIEAYHKLKGKTEPKSDCPGYYLYSLVKSPTQFDFVKGYNFDPEDFIIKAEKYGIPQKRHRIIILGIRKDYFKSEPELLEIKKQINIENVINGLPKLRSGLSKEEDSKNNWKNNLKHILSNDLLNLIEPDVRDYLIKTVEKLRAPRNDRGKEFVEYDVDIKYSGEKEWFLDRRIKGACNHSSRSHLVKDLHRYLFAATYASVKKKSPKLENFPVRLLPEHKNILEGKFSDRFRVHNYGEPSRTITSHISKDGHYYIHPDPSQCRSFTVREAARIQTFPDNYFFCGPRTSQYIQVGNAVPPLLAREIANVIKNIF